MESISVERLNSAAQNPNVIISESEERYAGEIERVAQQVYNTRAERPIVLISGPSGSGKTTTAVRIAHLLVDMGCTAHVISMDNYFLPAAMNEAARDKDGKIDYESPMRLDIDLFKEHLEKLSRCEEIDIPGFDFARQERIEGMPLKIEKGDVVILEGIHALNPLVTGDSDDYTSRVYVSVRTRIADGEKLLHPSKIRLMRRIIRDKLYRGRAVAETMEFFKSVERGENLYIMPFKHRANFDIDTFIGYEPLVYRDILLPELAEAAETYADYADYADMEEFMKILSSLDKKLVPENSLVREFVGE